MICKIILVDFCHNNKSKNSLAEYGKMLNFHSNYSMIQNSNLFFQYFPVFYFDTKYPVGSLNL